MTHDQDEQAVRFGLDLLQRFSRQDTRHSFTTAALDRILDRLHQQETELARLREALERIVREGPPSDEDPADYRLSRELQGYARSALNPQEHQP